MYLRVFFVDNCRLLLSKMSIAITVTETNTTAAVALMTAISNVGAATTGDSALVVEMVRACNI